MKVTQERLKACLSYDPSSGVFTWKARPLEHFFDARAWATWNTRFAGKQAGCFRDDGYVTIAIDGTAYQAHVLAWFYVHGKWLLVDHRNRMRDDNSLSNLREATNNQNAQNARMKKDGGIKGVHWYARKKKWQVQIKANKKRFHIGYFNTVEEAAAAYKAAAEKYHGEFANV